MPTSYTDLRMTSKKTSPSRRRFLKSAGLTAAAGLLPSCAALDRVLMGQTADLTDRTVILGAGLAGLRAAYELRKRGQPYRLIEGSNRIGGRARTLEWLTPAGQIGELGFEWFSQDQSVFWDLAKELKLEIVEVRNQRANLFLSSRGGVVPLPEAELRKIRDLARRNENLPSERSRLNLQRTPWRDDFVEAPPQSVQDWATKLSLDSAWLDLVRTWSHFSFGADPSQVHAIAFAQSFLFAESALDPWTSSRFKFRGGSSGLAGAMLDRVMGVIPGDRFLMGHNLTRVEKLNDGYELTFETAEGRRRFKARDVICTLPWSCLKNIDGFESFEGADVIRNASVSAQARGLLSFRERFWRRSWDQGRVLGSPIVWESTYRAQAWLDNSWGILSLTWSSAAAQGAGPHLIKKWMDGTQVAEKRSDLPLIETHLQDWTTHRWSQGARSFPDLKLSARFFDQPQGSWIWAGDHCGLDGMGSAAGALLSGARAAARIKNRG